MGVNFISVGWLNDIEDQALWIMCEGILKGKCGPEAVEPLQVSHVSERSDTFLACENTKRATRSY